jgi:hypothetical protein
MRRVLLARLQVAYAPAAPDRLRRITDELERPEQDEFGSGWDRNLYPTDCPAPH